MALFLITTAKRMRKIFSLLSKIKIRVISKQPQDLRVTESNWVVYNYFWTKENLKVFSIFCREPSNKVVINQKENKLVLRWKKLWQITNGEIFPPMLSQGRWIVFREKNYEKKIVEIALFNGLPLHLYIALVCCASPSLSSTYGTFPFIGTTLRMVGLPFLEKAVNG